MRFNLCLCVLSGALFATACSDAITASRPDPASIRCEIASAYIEVVIAEAKGRRIVFTTDDQSFDAPLVGGAWFEMGGERPRPAASPPAALVRRLQKQGNLNAVSRCESVRRLLDSRHIGYGFKAVDAVKSSDPSKLFDARIETVSLPVVSTDGQQAVLGSSGMSGALAGGGFLQLLERQADGKWSVVAFSPLWVA